jgi:hypothetical protein
VFIRVNPWLNFLLFNPKGTHPMPNEKWFVVFELRDGRFELITHFHHENRFHGFSPVRAYVSEGAPDWVRQLCYLRTAPFGVEPRIVEIPMPVIQNLESADKHSKICSKLFAGIENELAAGKSVMDVARQFDCSLWIVCKIEENMATRNQQPSTNNQQPPPHP